VSVNSRLFTFAIKRRRHCRSHLAELQADKVLSQSTNHCKPYRGQPRPSVEHAPSPRVLIDRSAT